MTSPLAASFVSPQPSHNVCLPGDTVTFRFANPPTRATNVVVAVLESVEFLHRRWSDVQDRFVGGFRGRIVNKRFQVEDILGAPPPPEPDPVTFEIAANSSPGAPSLQAHMPAPERVERHRLRLSVSGQVGGKVVKFKGRHSLNVEYPVAMVVPQRGAWTDPSLAMVEGWSRQWRAHRPNRRQVQHALVNRRSGRIAHAEYDDWIAKMTAAANFATAGVVAMALGHGDDGADPGTVAWCNLVPENRRPPLPFTYRLDIDDTVLVDGLSTIHPTGASRVKLHALDRLADALASTPIRRLLLHTCRVGASNGHVFLQHFADRVRVPVMAHRDFIDYEGFVGSGTMVAHYASNNPVEPRDRHEWPIQRVSRVFHPGAAPPRHGP